MSTQMRVVQSATHKSISINRPMAAKSISMNLAPRGLNILAHRAALQNDEYSSLAVRRVQTPRLGIQPAGVRIFAAKYEHCPMTNRGVAYPGRTGARRRSSLQSPKWCPHTLLCMLVRKRMDVSNSATSYCLPTAVSYIENLTHRPLPQIPKSTLIHRSLPKLHQPRLSALPCKLHSANRASNLGAPMVTANPAVHRTLRDKAAQRR